MSWFTAEFESFFRELKVNNNKPWFDANKSRYELHVKKPFEKFVGDAIVRMQKYDPQCRIEPKDAIFRIYKDVRFAKDKTPYKVHASAIITKGGRKAMDEPGIYLEIGSGHLRVYGGVYMPSTDQLKAIRQEIQFNEDEFSKALADKRFAKFYKTIRGEQNKRLPAELTEIQKRQPLIANKQFYYYADLDPSLITNTKLLDSIFEAYEASKPVKDFLQKAIYR